MLLFVASMISLSVWLDFMLLFVVLFGRILCCYFTVPEMDGRPVAKCE
jgi:hypothetical protein